jgi:hypothetical protein
MFQFQQSFPLPDNVEHIRFLQTNRFVDYEANSLNEEDCAKYHCVELMVILRAKIGTTSLAVSMYRRNFAADRWLRNLMIEL